MLGASPKATARLVLEGAAQVSGLDFSVVDVAAFERLSRFLSARY